MELQDYIKIFFQWLWLIILGVVIAMVSSYFAMRTLAPWPPYRAEATLLIGNVELVTTSGTEPLRTLIETYATLATQPPITQNVVDKLNLPMPAKDLSKLVKVGRIGDTQLLRISTTYGDPVQAANIANEVASQLQQSSPDSRRRDDTASVRLVTPAIPPQRPNISAYLGIVIAGALGFIITFGLILLIEYFDDRIRSPRDVTLGLGLPVLGTVQLRQRKRIWHLFRKPQKAATENIIEDCRWVQAKIGKLEGGSPSALMLTSPLILEDQAVLANGLARAWAEFTQSNVVVGSQTHSYEKPEWYAHYQNGVAEPALPSPAKNGHKNGHEKVPMMAATSALGVSTATSQEGLMLANEAKPTVLPSAYDVSFGIPSEVSAVVIDGPPVLHVADAVVLAAQIKNVLLVLEAGKSHMESARETISILDNVDSNVVGVVMIS